MGGKGGYSQFGHQFAYKESGGGDDGCSVDGQFQYLVDTMVLLGAEIVSGNGLHALV